MPRMRPGLNAARVFCGMRPALSVLTLTIVAFLAGCAGSGRSGGEHGLLYYGHSHNDYRQKHPLTDALRLGYLSIEADVFLVDGDLLVAHEREECRPDH